MRPRCVRIPIKATAREPIKQAGYISATSAIHAQSLLRNAAGPYMWVKSEVAVPEWCVCSALTSRHPSRKHASRKFTLRRRANHLYALAPSCPTKRGGSRSPRTRGRVRWTLVSSHGVRGDERTAKPCGPDAPTLASTRDNAFALRGDGGNKARFTRESAE